jgi:hypothetical protein
VRIRLTIFLVIAGILLDAPVIGAQEAVKPKKKATTIVGRVAVKVADIQDLNIGGHSESFTVFVISLESKRPDKQPDKLVQVRYSYSSDRQRLPEYFFDYSIRYRFRVVRDPSCDENVMDIRDPESGNLGGLAGEISPTRGAPNIHWDIHRPLDCYLLSPGKYKVQK